MLELIAQPWPWYVGGALVAMIMLLLIILGKTFGFSSNFRTICAALGAGKNVSFFRFDWKAQKWNLLFLVGTVLGGYIGAYWLSDTQVPAVSTETIQDLRNLGFRSVGMTYAPPEIFDVINVRNVLILLFGGILVGFGTRYAGGCTSGHAITGLSNLQLPSLIAVIGFFVGGLIMVHIIFPLIF